MDFAVVLYFNDEADQAIYRLMKNIYLASSNSNMLDVGIRPHITLAVFKDTDQDKFSQWLESYSKDVNSFNVKFSSIGIFPNDLSVLFIAPVVSREFVGFHNSFNEKVKEIAADFYPNYLPGNWVPHCTIANRLNKNELHSTLDAALAEFKPSEVTVNQISFIQCHPFKEIAAYNLGKAG